MFGPFFFASTEAQKTVKLPFAGITREAQAALGRLGSTEAYLARYPEVAEAHLNCPRGL
jgi:hypothetical protein